MAPGMWSFVHSLSSRTSINTNLSPRSRRPLTSSTFVSRMRLRVSSTICRKRGACLATVRSSASGRIEDDDDAGDVVARAALEGRHHEVLRPLLRVAEGARPLAQIVERHEVRQAVA